MDDNESVSTQSTQPISLTSFLHPTTNDSHTGVNSSLRQTRQRMNTNDNHPTRSRYSTRSNTTNHEQQQQVLSESDQEEEDEDDDEIVSNNKRTRIERSDRRISSVNRPNYKIDSDEEQEKVNTTNENLEDVEQVENTNEKEKGK